MGAETGLGAAAVERFHHGVEGALQVGHGDSFVHHEPFHLMEHGGVGGVHLVLAVDPAGGDDADGKGLGFHHVDLDRGGLGAQKNLGVIGEIEGILPLTGGMTLGCIEPRKVIIGQLHLGTFGNLEAHA
ncbi:hypothetical protein SDC9_116283 [bioreactor metagenome]|uniref:Uncharacterized protein n=1 Tax=bioreactor metagenome TaxID=1076179 RepID=A0A645BW57_9ZZZZ